MRWWALSLFISLVAAAFNVTVEDNDPRVIYTPAANWEVLTALVNGKQAYHGGSIHISYHVGAVASMKFNSSSHIYYIGEGNSDHGLYFVTVDGVTYPVSTTDETTETPQMMLFDLAVDPTKEHTISVTNAQDGKATVIDYFVYTFVEPAPTTPATTPPSTSFSTTSPSTTSSSAFTPTSQSVSTSTSETAVPPLSSTPSTSASAAADSSSSPSASETHADASRPTTSAPFTPGSAMPRGEIAAIATAGAAVLFLFACIAWWLYRRQVRARTHHEPLFMADALVRPYSTMPYSPTVSNATYSPAVSSIGSPTLLPAPLSSSDKRAPSPFVPVARAALFHTTYPDEKTSPPAYDS